MSFTLKEIGFTFKEIKAACISLNDCEIETAKINVNGITGESLLITLINTIEKVDDTLLNKIPADVQTLYDKIPDSVFNTNQDPDELAAGTKEADEPAPPVAPAKGKGKAKAAAPAPAVKEVVEEDADADAGDSDIIDPKHVSDCPTYLKGWNPKEAECVTCKKDFHKDYVNCKKAVKGITQAKKKYVRTGAAAAEKVKKTRYGHRVTAMVAVVDDMIWEGALVTDIVARIIDWHGKSEAAAKHAINIHTRYLTNTHGVGVVTDEKGFMKSDKEFIESRNAQNSADAVRSVVPE